MHYDSSYSPTTAQYPAAAGRVTVIAFVNESHRVTFGSWSNAACTVWSERVVTTSGRTAQARGFEGALRVPVRWLQQVKGPCPPRFDAEKGVGLLAKELCRCRPSTCACEWLYSNRACVGFLESGATAVGGCCSTTPEHIAAFAKTFREQSMSK